MHKVTVKIAESRQKKRQGLSTKKPTYLGVRGSPKFLQLSGWVSSWRAVSKRPTLGRNGENQPRGYKNLEESH